jgi:hypothetical protein
MSKNTLEQMKNVDISTVDPAELVDIREIQIDEQKTREERLRDFVMQVKNPYCFRVGKVAVKLNFPEVGATLEDRLQNLMTKL